MKIYNSDKKTLWEALELQPELHRVISLVGAGGKTTAICELAGEFASLGRRVIVTTTTRMFKPEHGFWLLKERAAEMAAYDWDGKAGFVTVGADAESGKIKGLSLEETAKLREYCDILLIEADGSKRYPFKVPKEWEPVILKETQAVVAVAGLSALGRPLKEVCFRWGEAERLFGAALEEAVTPELMARVLASRKGQRKLAGGREYRILLNQADTDEKRGQDVLDELKRLGPWKCVTVSLEEKR